MKKIALLVCLTLLASSSFAAFTRSQANERAKVVASYQKMISSGPQQLVEQLAKNDMDAAYKTSHDLFFACQQISDYNDELTKEICAGGMFWTCNNLRVSSKEAVNALFFQFSHLSLEEKKKLANIMLMNTLLESVH